ncbi:MAG: hypothetical protein ABIG91_00105 [Patescibacteria group bacterium]
MEMKTSYTVSIILKNGHRIMLDGFFPSLEEAQEIWELTKKEWGSRGYIKVSDKFIYYVEPKNVMYVRIGLTDVNKVVGKV